MQSKILNKLTDHQLIIFGLGREGLSSYNFLYSKLPQAKFMLIDERPLAELNSTWTKIVKSNSQVKFTTSITDVPQDELRHSLLFKTPGIPLSHPIVQKIINAGSQVTSNTQLFFDLVVENDQSSITTIGITGTKGKSTTSSLIHHLLKENQLDSYLCGNIGRPALDAWMQWQINKKDQPSAVFVLEMSCHQLAELKNSPRIAVIQDIISEHLDYYDSFEQYYQAKTQIARFQSQSDLLIYNGESKTATRLAALSPARKISFSLQDRELLEIAKSSLLIGQHNLYNIIPAIIIAQKMKLTLAQITAALKTFQPLPHRIEFVAEINGVKFYDDSIATVPEATIAAIQSFPDQNIVLIAGGYERQQDYKSLAAEIMAAEVKALALLPPTGQRLLRGIEHLNPCNNLRASIKEFSLMSEAVYYANQKANPGDIVLLSPGAASFNNFKDYIDRGNQFQAAVKRLKE